jgi:UDP-GlcNAc3NAcA epimerase
MRKNSAKIMIFFFEIVNIGPFVIKTTYMKTVHIVGNRPQFIKLSLLYRAWQRKGATRPLIIHTGQHFSDNMSDIFFQEFNIPAPDYQLNINNQPHAEMIGRMLIALDPVIGDEKPDGIIVYGDTNTTLAGALAAKKRNIRLAHVESGIRTGMEDMPEESNRYLTDRLADLNFACTYRGMENLLKEGYTPGGDTGDGKNGAIPGAESRKSHAISGQIFNTGDIMLDAALLFKDKARNQSSLLRSLALEGTPFLLATIHRAENLDNPEALGEILKALNILHRSQPVVFPVHPRTRQVIDQHRIPLQVLTIPPVGYLDMIALTQACQHVITDSGGLAREAFFFHKPSIIVMRNPFWPEIFEHGPCLQSGAEQGEILERFQALGNKNEPFNTAIFGDGTAAEKISDILLAAW